MQDTNKITWSGFGKLSDPISWATAAILSAYITWMTDICKGKEWMILTWNTSSSLWLHILKNNGTHEGPCGIPSIQFADADFELQVPNIAHTYEVQMCKHLMLPGADFLTWMLPRFHGCSQGAVVVQNHFFWCWVRLTNDECCGFQPSAWTLKSKTKNLCKIVRAVKTIFCKVRVPTSSQKPTSLTFPYLNCDVYSAAFHQSIMSPNLTFDIDKTGNISLIISNQ